MTSILLAVLAFLLPADSPASPVTPGSAVGMPWCRAPAGRVTRARHSPAPQPPELVLTRDAVQQGVTLSRGLSCSTSHAISVQEFRHSGPTSFSARMEEQYMGTVDAVGRRYGAQSNRAAHVLSDAVVAIAMTLLAIDLPVPTVATTPRILLHWLDEGVLEYLCFFVSFADRGCARTMASFAMSTGPTAPSSQPAVAAAGRAHPVFGACRQNGKSVAFVRFGILTPGGATCHDGRADSRDISTGMVGPTAPVRLSRRGGGCAAWIFRRRVRRVGSGIPAHRAVGVHTLWLVLPVALHRMSHGRVSPHDREKVAPVT